MMRIGYSSVDITPPLGVELCGYGPFLGRKAESILDPLYARAVFITRGHDRLLLINCDLLALTRLMTDAVKLMIQQELGIPNVCVMILATHTHTGPSTGESMASGLGEPDEQYVARLPDLLFAAAQTACRKTRAVSYARQTVAAIEPIGYNRTDAEGPVDSELRALAFYFNEGRPLVLLSHGCHPVSLGRGTAISADYPGCVVQELSTRGFDSIFLTGFCGDINPTANLTEEGPGRQKIITAYGRRLADAFCRTIAQASPLTGMDLDSYELSVALKLRRPDDAEIAGYLAKYENNASYQKVIHIWARMMKQQYANWIGTVYEAIAIQVMKIGDVLIIGVPAEVFMALGTMIKRQIPDYNILTLGCANRVFGYLSTAGDIQQHGYAGLDACYFYMRLPLAAGEGEKMAAEIVQGVKKINSCHGTD